MTSNFTCNTSSSVLGLSSSGAAVVTVTPRSDTCTVSSGGTSGGGGGYVEPTPVSAPAPAPVSVPSTPVSEPAPVTVAVAAPAVTPVSAPAAIAISPVFDKDFALGARSDDVKRLQELLATDSEIYPEGLTSGYYGSLTQAAVRRFQLKHGLIVNASDLGNGRVGPKTRAKLQEVFVAGIPAAPAVAQPSLVAAAVSPVFTTSLKKGVNNDDVKRLQQLLATDSEIYPEGTASGYFGNLTEKAVQKFQMKYGVVKSASDAGYGLVGPATRAKLQEVFGKTQPQTPSPAAPSADEAQNQALKKQLDDLQKQLNAMLKQAQQ